MSMSDSFDPVVFRQELHRFPEVSGKEAATAGRIIAQLVEMEYDRSSIKTNVGDTHGIIVEILGRDRGKSSIFRADFDALPIQEVASHDHPSLNAGVMHACGHDGHVSSLMAFAAALKLHPPLSGTIVLFFQPSEETGEGARAMLESPQLRDFHADYVFGYHNIPGYPLGTVLLKEGTFACASTGIKIKLTGKPTHAAYPEQGVSPAVAISELIVLANEVPSRFPGHLAMATVCHIYSGEENYGVAACNATLCLTIRSDNRDIFELIKELLLKEVNRLSSIHNLLFDVEWIDEFKATVNDASAVEMIRASSVGLGYTVVELPAPMRWSEDFGALTEKYSGGAYFGLGSGEDHPQLHNENYDFPDELIDIAKNIFMAVAERIHH